MGFKVDHSNVGGEFGPLPAGEYEVFPSVFDSKVSSSGNNMVTFNYLVRDDVEQEGKGKEIRFDNFVETDAAMWRINAASKAANLEHGKDYDSLVDWASDFKGKSVRVVVKIEEYTNNQGDKKQKNTITAFKESQVGGSLASEPSLVVDDESLPF